MSRIKCNRKLMHFYIHVLLVLQNQIAIKFSGNFLARIITSLLLFYTYILQYLKRKILFLSLCLEEKKIFSWALRQFLLVFRIAGYILYFIPYFTSSTKSAKNHYCAGCRCSFGDPKTECSRLCHIIRRLQPVR